MTVRWKPLFILSGLFFVVAVLGVIAMAWTLVPKSAQGVLKQARAAAAAGRFENAEIYYEQALQFEAKNASIHEEFANLYRDWGKTAAADRQEIATGQTCRSPRQGGEIRQERQGAKIAATRARHGPG